MSDPRVEKLADVLVNYSTEVQPGDWVLVRGNTLTLPLLEAIVKEVVKAGGNPTIQLESDDLNLAFVQHASQEQADWVAPIMETMAEQLDVRIVVRATSNTRNFAGVDPAIQRTWEQARRRYQDRIFARSAAGEHRWVLTNYPCAAYAQDADMSLHDYEDFVYAATYADQADPVACWQKIHDMQQVYIDYLEGKEQIAVRGPNIDMTLSIAGRSFINSDGKRNMPSGEIFTGPVEDSVNGWVKFTYPGIRLGREVSGVSFEFKDGKLVEARADKNEGYLLSQLETDPGARYLGEFAIGTNYQIQQFTKQILYDEKIGGTLHMAVGAGYPETGSQNRSKIHWDFICDMREQSEILVDGELFYKDGQFQI